MWDFSLEEAKLGIRASMKEYEERYHRGDSEIVRKMELNQGRYGWKTKIYTLLEATFYQQEME